MESNYLKELDIKIVILSRSRYDSISTHELLPDFIEVVVPESQKEKYEERISNPIITCPDEVKGLGYVRNWILSRFKEDTVIMIDDDIKTFYCLTREKTRRIDDPQEFLEILVNTAIMAKDAGAKVFGFSQTDIRKYNGCDPFNLCTWVGCIIGVNGRKYEFRKDKFKVDIDYCLQSLLVDRIIWCDDRYWASQNRDNNIGGNSEFRNEENYNESLQSLLNKWGRFLKQSKNHKNNVSLKLNVKRKQDIKYE